MGVEKSKVANRLKRVLTRFEADRSHVRGVNGRPIVAQKLSHAESVENRRYATHGDAATASSILIIGLNGVQTVSRSAGGVP